MNCKLCRGRKALLLGSGELGKEVAIELQRYGVEVVACDKYAGAPAMQVADRSHVFNMLDGQELRRVIELERPDHIIPEVEAIATPVLVELEKGLQCHPYGKRCMAHHEQRGHKASGGRRIAVAHIAVSFCVYSRGIHCRGRAYRNALCGQACHEFQRSRPEHSAPCRPDRRRMERSSGRRTCRSGPCDCGRLCRF